MAKDPNITADEMRQLLAYDPETGVFRWKPRTPDMFAEGNRGRAANCKRWNTKHAGNVAAHPASGGYLSINLLGRPTRAHRIACLMMTGEWPPEEADHEDLDRANNKWSNLRQATVSQNRANRAHHRNNRSGVKGASWDAARNKWQAHICVNRKKIMLGRFETAQEAGEAYRAAAAKYFGEFARAFK